MGIFSTMMWNAIHMATHGLTTVNKRVEPIRWDLKIRRSSPNSLNGSPALLRRNIENINLPDTFSFAASTLSGSFRNCPYR